MMQLSLPLIILIAAFLFMKRPLKKYALLAVAAVGAYLLLNHKYPATGFLTGLGFLGLWLHLN